MNLYILRHARAEERSARYRNDSLRPLTREGIKRQQLASRGMRAMKLKFDLILSSPFARARHTAEIVADVMATGQPRYTRHLASGADSRHLIEEINDHHASAKSILLVGHEPGLSKLISRLVCGNESLHLDFKKSALCKLTVGDLRFGVCAKLEWILTGKHLGALADS